MKSEKPDNIEDNDNLKDGEDSLSTEIDAAIDSKMSENKPDDAGEKKNDLPPGEALPGDDAEDKNASEEGDDDDVQGDGSEASDAVSDEHIERAVKSGMSIADAKMFKDAKSLVRICDMLDSAKAQNNGADGDKSEKGKSADSTSKDGDDIDSVLNSIPDLDPADYDEKIVAGFKAMKEIIKSQNQTIGKLKAVGEESEGTWLDSQIAGLSKAYPDEIGSGPKSKLEPNSSHLAKRAEIEERFAILEAGYKAAGKEIDRASLFEDAASLALGGSVSAKLRDLDKAESLAKRSKQHINRPGGQMNREKVDPFVEAADALDRKFFGKK